ncbi:hypothetical protein FZC33_15945 [Labrys sp. KNU-23]|uniref:hypothetical protein n=1 Tax=Labrys sp. KNU-23 TaxID=2789216 RepID=UPI0011ED927D|nr:hypothetical protein [Labrys sp. KNU-23]QEN87719.1 hypothetical protein FZC33_15945 [Labrys sp. KNU-23]
MTDPNWREALHTETIETIDSELRRSIDITSNSIGIIHTGRQNRSLFMLNKLITHILSMTAIVERTLTIPDDNSALVDHFSIAALGRITLDASIMIMYFSDPKITMDQWNLRRHLLFLHDLFNRRRFLESAAALNGKPDPDFEKSYPILKVDLRAKIEQFALNLGYPQAEIEEYKKGQRVFVDGIRGAVREAGWNVDEFDLCYSYWSAFIHSHPVSYMRAQDHGITFGKPAPMQLDLCSQVFHVVNSCLKDVNIRMASFVGAIERDHLGHID